MKRKRTSNKLAMGLQGSNTPLYFTTGSVDNENKYQLDLLEHMERGNQLMLYMLDQTIGEIDEMHKRDLERKQELEKSLQQQKQAVPISYMSAPPPPPPPSLSKEQTEAKEEKKDALKKDNDGGQAIKQRRAGIPQSILKRPRVEKSRPTTRDDRDYYIVEEFNDPEEDSFEEYSSASDYDDDEVAFLDRHIRREAATGRSHRAPENYVDDLVVERRHYTGGRKKSTLGRDPNDGRRRVYRR